MLKVDRVCAYYGDLQVLWDLSLNVKPGEIVALIGGNGAGKTTALKVITGLMPARSGDVYFGRTSLARMKPHQIVDLGISMAPEGRRLFGKMPVEDNLRIGAFISRARKDLNVRLDQVYGIFPVLKERRRQMAGSLSGGEQQMVSIGRALMAGNNLLILDEMSLGLAPRIVEEIFEVVVRLNESGLSILLVEQNVPNTLAIAHRAYVIENGRIVKEGGGQELLDDPYVQEAYLGLTDQLDGFRMLQTLVYGLLNGFQYSIIALGISLVFGVMRYLNLAHGSLIILGSYACLFLYQAGLDPFVSIPLLMLGLFILGAILFKLLYARLVGLQEGLRVQKSLLISFGLMLVIDNFSTLVWTSDERAITPSYAGSSVEILGVHVPLIGLSGGVLAVMIILGLHFLFTRTMFGKSVVAVSQDHEAAGLSGVNVGKTFLISFGLSVSLAAVPAVLIGLQSFSPSAGILWFNQGIVVVLLAGLGNLYGVFPAGIFLGLIEAISVFFFGAPYREIAGLTVFVLVLILFPQGLFGKVEA